MRSFTVLILFLFCDLFLNETNEGVPKQKITLEITSKTEVKKRFFPPKKLKEEYEIKLNNRPVKLVRYSIENLAYVDSSNVEEWLCFYEFVLGVEMNDRKILIDNTYWNKRFDWFIKESVLNSFTKNVNEGELELNLTYCIPLSDSCFSIRGIIDENLNWVDITR